MDLLLLNVMVFRSYMFAYSCLVSGIDSNCQDKSTPDVHAVLRNFYLTLTMMNTYGKQELL